MAESKNHSLGSPIVRVLCGLIKLYQWQSPFWGPHCRFYPSCSEYMKEALLTHGVIQGLGRGSFRILKCHPWHPGGIDLVRTEHGK